MILESFEWELIYGSLIAFVNAMAVEVTRYGTSFRPLLRWRSDGGATFTLDRREELVASDEAGGTAFHLPEFKEFVRVVHSTAIRSVVGQAIGPKLSPGILNLEDFTFRLAAEAILLEADGSARVDDTMVASRMRALKDTIENDVLFTEVTVYFRKIVVQRTIELDETSTLKRAGDEELIELINAGLLAPRLHFDKFYDRPAGQVHVNEADRCALTLRIPSENVIKLEDKMPANYDFEAAAFRQAERLADVIAILQGKSIEIVGWVARTGVITTSGSMTYKALAPLGPLPYATRPAFDAEAFRDEAASLWRQLLMAELDPDGGAIRLAARRLGFAALRESDQDRLIDSMIALEALLIGRGEEPRNKGAAIAGRVGPVLAGRTSLSVKPGTLLQAYRTRDNIVHGDVVDASIITRDAAISLNVARAVCKARFDRVDERNSYLEDWHDMLAEFKALR